MNLRWLWFDHFPPGLTLAREERANVRQRARVMRKRNPHYHGAHRRLTLLYAPFGIVGTGILTFMWFSPDNTVIFTLTIFCCCLAGVYAHHHTHAPFIRHALHYYGHEVCIDCGYWLRGLGDKITKCPECGAARDEELKRIARENDLPPVQMRREDRPPRGERTASRDSEA